MLKLSIGISLGIAVLGLLFYWRKRVKSAQIQHQEEQNVAEYGVLVRDADGILRNLTDRPVMVADVITVPYGNNGSITLNSVVSSVAVDINYDINPDSDGKVIKVTYSGNTVQWHWVSMKSLMPSNAKLIIFTGGRNG